jgi:DnaJ like chaperone protein
MVWSVVLGALLGLEVTRTIYGAVIGALVGYLVDQALRSRAQPAGPPVSFRSEFLRITFEVMGYLAKADGLVSEAEIDAARRLMHEFGLDEVETASAMQNYRTGKSAGFSPDIAVEHLRELCARRYDLLRHFMDLQLMAALRGNGIAPPARAGLLRIAEQLGFSGLEFAYMEVSVRAQYSRRRTEAEQARKSTLDECYAELEVDANISDQELTKAYRRMMSRHHPDKLVANGLPESMAQSAKEKTQRIQEAYEGIRAARGMR